MYKTVNNIIITQEVENQLDQLCNAIDNQETSGNISQLINELEDALPNFYNIVTFLLDVDEQTAPDSQQLVYIDFLSYAIMHYNFLAIETLINKGANPRGLPIKIAIGLQNNKIQEHFLKFIPQEELRNILSSLISSTPTKNIEKYKFFLLNLLEHLIAKEPKVLEKTIINSNIDKQNYDVASFAIKYRNYVALELLLSHGASAIGVTDILPKPLHIAIANHDQKAQELLLSYINLEDLQMLVAKIITQIDRQHNNYKLILNNSLIQLLKSGINHINDTIITEFNLDMLTIATKYKNYEAVTILLSNGVSPYGSIYSPSSPIRIAYNSQDPYFINIFSPYIDLTITTNNIIKLINETSEYKLSNSYDFQLKNIYFNNAVKYIEILSLFIEPREKKLEDNKNLLDLAVEKNNCIMLLLLLRYSNNKILDQKLAQKCLKIAFENDNYYLKNLIISTSDAFFLYEQLVNIITRPSNSVEEKTNLYYSAQCLSNLFHAECLNHANLIDGNYVDLLSLAIMHNNKNAVETLLTFKVNVMGNKNNPISPLALAHRSGKEEIKQLLLQQIDQEKIKLLIIQAIENYEEKNQLYNIKLSKLIETGHIIGNNFLNNIIVDNQGLVNLALLYNNTPAINHLLALGVAPKFDHAVFPLEVAQQKIYIKQLAFVKHHELIDQLVKAIKQYMENPKEKLKTIGRLITKIKKLNIASLDEITIKHNNRSYDLISFANEEKRPSVVRILAQRGVKVKENLNLDFTPLELSHNENNKDYKDMLGHYKYNDISSYSKKIKKKKKKVIQL